MNGCKRRRHLSTSPGFIFALLLFIVPASLTYAGTVNYQDKLGRTVILSVPVKRAVLFETYELTAALGVWDRIAGISRYAHENDLMLAVKPDIAKTIPAAGSGLDTNIEALLKLRPDLVLTWTFKPEAVKFLEEKGLKVIAVYPESLRELYEVMRLQGKLFAREEKVEQSIILMEEMFNVIGKRVAAITANKRRKVLWLGGRSNSVAGGIGINNDLFTLIRGSNPAADIPQRSADVSIERIIAWDPEVIFIWGNAKYGPEDLTGSPQWRHVHAVRDGRVYKAPPWSTWSPRLAPVALWMAMKTYPEYFKDINMNSAIDGFYKKVFGIPYGRVIKIEK